MTASALVTNVPPFSGTSDAAITIPNVLPALRDQRGRPAAPIRLLALLVAVGLLALAAPALVVFVRWMLDALL